MADIVLVAGTHFGGWHWEILAQNLRQLGHRVLAPTLPGLAEAFPPPEAISLDQHIDFVAELIVEQGFKDVTLLGWSYGGMVITGVPSRLTTGVNHLIYLDAAVPLPGQSEFDLVPEWLSQKQLSESPDGLNIYPSADFLVYEPRMKPHPLGTKIQPITYDEGKYARLAKTYVVAHGEPGGNVFPGCVERIRQEPNWTILEWPFGHDLYRDAPNQVEQLLLAAVR